MTTQEILEQWKVEAKNMSTPKLWFWALVTLLPSIFLMIAENGEILGDELDRRLAVRRKKKAE